MTPRGTVSIPARILYTRATLSGGVSSAVEHLLYTQEVGGSNPSPRTIPPVRRRLRPQATNKLTKGYCFAKIGKGPAEIVALCRGTA
jgi:hypothetical protein